MGQILSGNTFILFIYRDYRAQDYVTRAATLYRFYILRIQLKQILNKIFCFAHFMQISVCIEAANLHKCFTEKGFKILQNTLFFFEFRLDIHFTIMPCRYGTFSLYSRSSNKVLHNNNIILDKCTQNTWT